MKTDQSSFLSLAQKADLDEETAYAVCRMIDVVGYAVKDNWDWNWLEGRKKSYRSLIDRSLIARAWRLLAQKEWLSFQTTNSKERRIATIAPLEGMTNLRSLVLQENHITDLQPLLGMARLRYLNCYSNRICDIAPLAHLQSLEELHLGKNPIKSFAVLEQLTKLRKLMITAEQIPALMLCRWLSSVQCLRVDGGGSLDNLADFPEMLSLNVLCLPGLKDTAGIERFDSLTTLELRHARFSQLDRLAKLKRLTHLEIQTSQAVSLHPLSALVALRSVHIRAPKVDDLPALTRLPVLHQINIDEQSRFDRSKFKALSKGLTPWADEFTTTEKRAVPSLEVQVVSRETFDFYDTKEPFGIRPGECEDGMFHSEREWLVNELAGVLTTRFEEGYDKDLFLPGNSGLRRSEKLVIYGLCAYESCREIVTAVQQVLSQARNDWIIYFQSLLSEGPDFEELPEDTEDFTVWIYPDKILATRDNAAIIRKLIEWR